ncbi:MAG: hypothetical protein AB7T18_16650 [Alphaproteobacteria bacterium]
MIRRLLGIARDARNDFLNSQELIRRHLVRIQSHLHQLAIMEHQRYLKDILSDPKYDDRKRLERYGFKVYSQNDEDGIIQEIFARIGTTSKTFIEFGVENGLENNTVVLLLQGWEGLWIEGNEGYVSQIASKFSDEISNGRLRVQSAFIDRDNINGLIGAYFTGEIDLLSIDIDGNDIYILESLDIVQPRVVVIEYNAKFPPPISVTQRYDPGFRWRGTDYMGASLAAIAKVAAAKGYSLVGCSVAGVNAFLVRDDLLHDRFLAPFTAENHYQPARYFLAGTFFTGHPPDWGPYETV